MRGGVSLAAALALPYWVNRDHVPFPMRDLVIFLTFCVILATLLLQGLSLPILIRRLGVSEDGIPQREEAKAQLTAARAALARLDELAEQHEVPPEVVDHLRSHYEERSRLHMARYRGEENEGDEAFDGAYRRLQSALLQVEREAIIGLRDRGVINDEAMRTVQHSLDLEAVRLEA
jgi:CPA1 family monovalent cation:H+ antiporter